jgi:hypothetical protein
MLAKDLIRSDGQVTLPIPDTCSICQKQITLKSERKNKNLLLSVGNILRVQRCMHSLFPSYLMQPAEEIRKWPEAVCQATNVDFFGTRESFNVFQNWFWQVKYKMSGSVRLWKLFVKKTSLHINCLKTTDGLARAGYNVTWPAWALVQSRRCVCLLIQSNCTELQPSRKIAIWITWLFTRHVKRYFDSNRI